MNNDEKLKIIDSYDNLLKRMADKFSKSVSMSKEDLYQEGVLAMLQSLKDGMPENPNFKTIIKNRFINLSKSAAWGYETKSDGAKEVEALEQIIDNDIYSTNGLTELERHVLILKFFQFSNTQISDLVDINRQKIDEIVTTVKEKLMNS